jgi:hypothetical protein
MRAPKRERRADGGGGGANPQPLLQRPSAKEELTAAAAAAQTQQPLLCPPRPAKLTGELFARLDEFMVLLWYAWETKMDKALTSELATYNRDFFVEPCTMFESNVYQKIKIEEENADGRREREALEGKLRARNPLDLSLYAAVEELFEKQVQWADAQPELAQWMEKARNGQLKKCKEKVKSQDDAVWSSSGRKTGREKGGWKPSA